ncbi:MAG: serine/threonine-protein kinase [Myxococcota bacterium]|nr:serine/threonine-protein kinase [Myxococcota bacterium]
MEKLGEGGMGAIYKARQLSMERMVALKILLRNRRGDPISVERFRHEAYLASRLRHPNAVVIYDFGKSDSGLLYIAMELLAGQNLKQRMRQSGPMGVTKAVGILRQNLRPISQAHRMGLIHRDLKPANIFLTTVEGNSDFVKVLDFGVAKLTAVQDTIEEGYQGGLTVAGKIYGTPNYMSPEQIRGKELNNQSDLYSLGVIFYEMLCGKRPFEAETPVDVMMMHLRDQPARPSSYRGDLPDGLEAVVMKALAKDREVRFSSGEEFLEALEPFRSGVSAEHPAFGYDKHALSGSGQQDVVDEEPVLSGLDFSVDGFDSMLDDLNDEKTVLDTGEDSVDSKTSALIDHNDEDERTVFEQYDQLDLGSSVGDSNALSPETSSDRLAAAPLSEKQTGQRASSDMSVLELGSSEFEHLDPSRLVDIPKMSERVKPETRGGKARPTMMGFPGGGSPNIEQSHAAAPIVNDEKKGGRPTFPTSRPAVSHEPVPVATPEHQSREPRQKAVPNHAQDVGALKDKSTLPVQSEMNASKRTRTVSADKGGSRPDATAFALPSKARSARSKKTKSARFGLWAACVLMLAGIGVGLTFYVTDDTAPKKAAPKPSVTVYGSSELEITLNGLFVVGGQKRVLGKEAGPQKLGVSYPKKKALFVDLGTLTRETSVYIELASQDGVDKLGVARIGDKDSVVSVSVKGSNVGTTPVLFIGAPGTLIEAQVGERQVQVKIP